MDSEISLPACAENMSPVAKLPLCTLTKIFQYASKSSRKTLAHRLVCHQWNSCIYTSFQFHFHLLLTDAHIHDYLNLFQSTLPKLKIGSAETHDLTQLSYENLLSLFSVVSFDNVKRFEFGEGTSRYMMELLLLNFPRIQTLNFEEVWCPVFEIKSGIPTTIQKNPLYAFDDLKEFTFNQPLLSHNHNQNSEVNPVTENCHCNAGFIPGDGEELQDFFRTAFFPRLQKLDLTIVAIAEDKGTYLWVHYFIAKHYKTLNDLSLSFCAALESKLLTSSWMEQHGDGDGYDNELNKNHSFKKDIQNFKSDFLRMMENDENYKNFCHNIHHMRLKHLTLSFIKYEGSQNPPWNQSLKFLGSPNNCLEEIEVNGGSEHDSQHEIMSAIEASTSTLRILCIRNVPGFDCSVIDKCKNLEAFSFGRLFTPITQIRRESLENLNRFPESNALNKLRCVLIGVPLSKENLFILAEKLKQVQILWVRGDGGDLYSIDDLHRLMKEMLNLHELEMRIQMEQSDKEAMADYFLRSSEWSIRYLINEFDNITEVEFNVHKKFCLD